ncbi:trehalose operon repressor [Paludibacterium purpuratum]|uniref:Trehalose operon repressor n=1 Tax=Paludibacterium purpuratum TaxID=1144873 RepID=A0A4R7BAG4_9NEIS|nr:trehalose operon repressor [Paludibacterium purpuratum]TDR80627.1 GntR family transcriptional regulator [Paludibacterium purpuratum]
MNKYNQILSDIVADIDNLRYRQGDRIPSESELMDSYQASRGTVRKAVDLLQERGYVQKIHGKGVFVLRPGNIEFQLNGIVSFEEANQRLGRVVVSRVVEMETIPATPELARLLDVREKTPLIKLKRVRRIDEENVILDINHFVASLVPGLTRDIAGGSIYRYLEQDLGLHISYAQRIIEAQSCSDDDRRYLDLNGMDHVIVVKNHTHLYDGRLFEYTESRHRLDKFYFSDVARR